MPRTLTQEEISTFKETRNKQRQKQGLPPFDELDPDQKQAALEVQKSELLQSAQLTLRSRAWPLGKYPMNSHLASCSGTLELPRHYLAAFGCDRIKYHEGDNINLLTYQYYDDTVDPTSYSGSNFVTEGGIHPKRHEYLGPYPKVAGYWFNDGVTEIRFWDEHLNIAWIGKRRWDVELEFDPLMEGWRVVDHT